MIYKRNIQIKVYKNIDLLRISSLAPLLAAGGTTERFCKHYRYQQCRISRD